LPLFFVRDTYFGSGRTGFQRRCSLPLNVSTAASTGGGGSGSGSEALSGGRAGPTAARAASAGTASIRPRVSIPGLVLITTSTSRGPAAAFLRSRRPPRTFFVAAWSTQRRRLETGRPSHRAASAVHEVVGGVVRKRAKRPGREPGECGFDSHPRYSSVSAGHRRAQVAVTHPRSLCRFDSCPTH